MLIDQFLPHYDVNARHQIDIRAPIGRAYSVTRFLDMRDSRIVRWLYSLRGLPEYNLTLDGMLKWGFVLLADKPSQEIVFGLIGRFWTPSAQIQSINADAFVKFDRPGFAKAAGNMTFIPQDDGSVRVTTETRVHCLDNTSRRHFRLYWLLIGPFSSIIRKEWLRLIKQRAEAQPSHV
ncbi:MAG: hypothetical protein GXO90_03655 [FCB group bacterium]|nr:hypothetical protein [FCB group bacterium]